MIVVLVFIGIFICFICFIGLIRYDLINPKRRLYPEMLASLDPDHMTVEEISRLMGVSVKQAGFICDAAVRQDLFECIEYGKVYKLKS